MNVLVEACVDSVESAIVAERAGARRLELCVDLDVGGTTPGEALVRAVQAAVAIPISMMVRPRGGSYVHSRDELDTMRRTIDNALALGVGGIVIGLLDDDDRIDVVHTREFVARARPTPVTVHRAFDVVADQARALDELIDTGVARVLTSGGAPTALEGADRLRALVDRAAGRIVVMAGGKVRPENARAIAEQSGVAELHARSEMDPGRIHGIIAALESLARPGVVRPVDVG